MNPRDPAKDDIEERRTPDDRLLDMALGEVLGGRRAPDLTGAVARALAEEKPVPARARIAVVRRARWLVAGAVCGAAAAGVLAWLAGVRFSPPPTPPRAARVTVERGAATHVDAAELQTIHVATGGSLALHTSDRLRAQPPAGAELRMGELGVLAMASGSEIEVLHMNWKDFGTGGVLGSITVAVAVGAVQWLGASTPVQAHEGQQIELTREGGGELLTSAQAGELREQLAAAHARVAELEQAAARRPVQTAAEPPLPEPPPELAAASTEAAPPFHYTGMDSALAAIDWNAMGGATAEMLPLLAELVSAMEDGKQVPLDVAAQIQAVNAELVKQAKHIVDGGIPGEGVNGAFTHPLVVANQLHALFEKAGLPMTASQESALQEISARFAGEDDARRAVYAEDTPALQRVLDEMALKERFYREARGALGPDQLALITNSATQGYTGLDIIGTGVAWAQFARPMPAADAASFGSDLGNALTSKLKLSDADAQRVRSIVQKWTSQLPSDVWKSGDAAHTKLNFLPVSTVQAAAQAQLGMMQEILGSVTLSPEQRKQMLQNRAVFVPTQP